MMVIELWHLILLLLAFFGACGATVKYLFNQNQHQQDLRFGVLASSLSSNHAQLTARLGGIETAAREDANNWQRLERDFLTFKSELPVQYVRREDYIRGQTVIEAKLDSVAMRIENMQLRALNNERTNHGN